MSKIIKIGGVPEHFNFPIVSAIELKVFEYYNIQLEWTYFKGGTGQMTKALRDGTIDICILLTEGIVSDIINGNPSKLISGYINTPLTWGIHTGYDNPLNNVNQIFDKKYAISRFGSGSHLMAIVHANESNKKINMDQFNVIKNLDGALNSLTSLENDIFYWEKFTTQPFVTSKMIRRLGTYTTPWPCFVIAATDSIIDKQGDTLEIFLKLLHENCHKFMHDKESVKKVSEKFKLELKEVEKWFHKTEWATHGWLSNKMIESVIYNLTLANIIDQKYKGKEIVWKR